MSNRTSLQLLAKLISSTVKEELQPLIQGEEVKPINKEIINDFVDFCRQKLDLKKMPNFTLHRQRPQGMTTGMFIPSENTIHVVVKNRLLADILKTIAHELAHRKQDERGLLGDKKSDDLRNDLYDPNENEAYMLAGNFVKEFMIVYNKISRDDLYELYESKFDSF